LPWSSVAILIAWLVLFAIAALLGSSGGASGVG
jgi:hypothetical protein